MILHVVLALLIIILVGFNLKKFLKPSNKHNVPGPFCLPVVGYLPIFFAKQPIHVFYEKMAAKYGPVFRVRIGVRDIVVLNSIEAIREAFTKINLAGRPENQPVFDLIKTSDGQQAFSFVSAVSPLWKFHRKNCLSALSVFATSKNSRLREITEQGFHRLESQLDANLGLPFNPKKAIFDCIAGIIGRINFGYEFDPENPMLKTLLELTEESLEIFEASGIVDCFPYLKFLFRNKLKKLERLNVHSNVLISGMLSQHTFDEGDEVRDVADALHVKSGQISAEEYGALGLNRLQVLSVTVDLFQAGFMTTMESFMWALVLMARHPQVQKKVREELLEAMDVAQFPAVNDKQQTPYTEAALAEVFRVSSLVPLALPHSVIGEDSVQGYTLSEGALLFANTYAVHHDANVFPEPHRFLPERYFKNGKLDVPLLQSVIPFSVGKRRCVGENLARQELYLLFCATMKKYDVSLHGGDDSIGDLDACVHNALMRTLKPIDIVFRHI